MDLRLKFEVDNRYYVILEHDWIDNHRIIEEWGFDTHAGAKDLFSELEEKYNLSPTSI
jgi:hypothetical protein